MYVLFRLLWVHCTCFGNQIRHTPAKHVLSYFEDEDEQGKKQLHKDSPWNIFFKICSVQLYIFYFYIQSFNMVHEHDVGPKNEWE